MNDAVKNILENSVYCTIATVSEDGAPWNVPVRFAYDEKYLYFRSPVGTTHGKNIASDNRVSVVVVDTGQTVKGAVYIHSSAERLNGTDEAVAAEVFNRRFNYPPQQWDQTEYYRIAIGKLDESRTMGEMYYFHDRSMA